MTQLDRQGGNHPNTFAADFGNPVLRTYSVGDNVITADPLNGEILRHDVLQLYADARLAAIEARIDLTTVNDRAEWALGCMSDAIWEPFRSGKHIIKPLDTLVIHGEGKVLTFNNEDEIAVEIADDRALIGKLAAVRCVQYRPFESEEVPDDTTRRCGAMLLLSETTVFSIDDSVSEIVSTPVGAYVPVGMDTLTIEHGYNH